MKSLALMGLLGICLMAAPTAQAQPVSFGFSVGVAPAVVGPPPVCTYGYYSFYPYACAPYGYYGPQWFVGGVFIGAGPWFHGYSGWRGYYGHPGYGARGGYYGRPGYYGRSGFRGGFAVGGPAHYGAGAVRGGIHSGYAHGGTAWSGSRGGAFHAGGGFHGGGYHGGGHR
ncbi:MAG TPA: hypothetical protein VMO17_14815 [Terriglobia bacterium]|nr:hypothetical protein [Terriglobia bacterium]